MTAPVYFRFKKTPMGRRLRYTSGPNAGIQQRRRSKSRSAYYSICYFIFSSAHCQAQLCKFCSGLGYIFVRVDESHPAIDNRCHCEGAIATVAISRYCVPSCPMGAGYVTGCTLRLPRPFGARNDTCGANNCNAKLSFTLLHALPLGELAKISDF